GTIHEVVNGFFDEAGTPLGDATRVGVLPLGTGGDFRRTFEIPTDHAAAAAVLRAGRTRRIDLGRVTFRRPDGSAGTAVFCNIADAGLGGEVVHRVNHGLHLGAGALTFALASGVSLLTWRNRRLRVEADGAVEEMAAQQAVVANARYYGGGMCIAPCAEPDDGLLDLVLVGDVGKLQNVRLLGPLRSGTHLDGRFPITSRRVREVTVAADRPTRLDVDGEQPGRLPATFAVIPGALDLVVP
ncbi:MAG: diacylglycerol/lipid kinase family protein, partial [Candidatus Dormibacteraceae bacterium]